MRARGDGGFVLLVMMGVIAASSLGILIAVGQFVPWLAERAGRTEGRLVALAGAAREQFRRDGAFPSDLDALASGSWLDPEGAWRVDPWSLGQEFVCQRTASTLTLASCGPDRSHGTADDVVCTVGAETMERIRHRGRLRLLRALFAASPYRTAATMSPAERAAMQAAMRDYAAARRGLWQADTATRAALTATMATAATTVATLALSHGCLPLPAALTGAGGLMQALGCLDAAAVDGAGRSLVADPVVGFVAVGNDGIGGTDDDM